MARRADVECQCSNTIFPHSASFTRPTPSTSFRRWTGRRNSSGKPSKSTFPPITQVGNHEARQKSDAQLQCLIRYLPLCRLRSFPSIAFRERRSTSGHGARQWIDRSQRDIWWYRLPRLFSPQHIDRMERPEASIQGYMLYLEWEMLAERGKIEVTFSSTGWPIMMVKTSFWLRFEMFGHPAWAVGSYSSGPPAARSAGIKSTGGFYRMEWSPCTQHQN